MLAQETQLQNNCFCDLQVGDSPLEEKLLVLFRRWVPLDMRIMENRLHNKGLNATGTWKREKPRRIKRAIALEKVKEFTFHVMPYTT
jgi:hypothetical protein